MRQLEVILMYLAWERGLSGVELDVVINCVITQVNTIKPQLAFFGWLLSFVENYLVSLN